MFDTKGLLGVELPVMIRDIVVDEYYHLFNRGVGKKIIFKDDRDRIRFLFLILYFQANVDFSKNSRIVSSYVKHRMFDIQAVDYKKIVSNKRVDLVSFTLMTNHFHLIVKENKEGGVGKYMQRVLNSYTKYFNSKYDISGHLFEGPYKAVHVKSNEQLLHLSAYVHLNQREIGQWKNKEDNYEWSSYYDYVHGNRWGEILSTGIVLNQFKNFEEYKKFVKESGVKDDFDYLE